MPRRASRWIIHETKHGWDVSRGGRYYYNELSSQAEALRRMKSHYRVGEPVFLEDSGGARTNITDRLKRKGII